MPDLFAVDASSAAVDSEQLHERVSNVVGEQLDGEWRAVTAQHRHLPQHQDKGRPAQQTRHRHHLNQINELE